MAREAKAKAPRKHGSRPVSSGSAQQAEALASLDYLRASSSWVCMRPDTDGRPPVPRHSQAAARGRAVRLARREARPDGPPRHGARLTARRTHKISPDGIILDQRQPEWHTVVLRRTKRLRQGSGR